MAINKKAKIAFFDLDYTIIPHDTLFLFASFILRKKPLRIYFLLFVIPAFALYLTGLLDAQNLKRAFLTIIAGLSKEEIETLVDEFSTKLLEHTYTDIVKEINRHKTNKTKLILNTASPVFYIEPFGKKLGFDECIGSTFIIDPKMPLFARTSGKNNKNLVKLDNMKKWVNPELMEAVQNKNHSVFIKNSDSYSDSPSDLPLLRIAERKHTVNPGKKLIQIARAQSWQIWRPEQPYKSNTGKFLVSLKQLFGLYKI